MGLTLRLSALAFCILLFAAGGVCAAETPEALAPAASSADITEVLAPYLRMQQALASDNVALVQREFRDLGLHTQAVIARLAIDPSSAHPLAQLYQVILGSHRMDIGQLRKSFMGISHYLVLWIAEAPDALTDIRVFTCPRFGGPDEARWVQTEAEIHNPYFGSKMLSCGTAVPLTNAKDRHEPH